MRRAVCLLLSLAVCWSAWATESWPTGWTGYVDVTIPNPDANLTQHPVAIQLSGTNGKIPKANTHSDGWIVYDPATGTRLNHEQESFGDDGTYAVAVIWVAPNQYATPSGSQNHVHIYYHSSKTDASNTPASVWDANYEAVWHLGETGAGKAGDFKDSTTGGNNSTNTSGEPSVSSSGVIGNCQTFNGSQYLDMGVAQMDGGGAGSWTITAWAKPLTTGSAGTHYIFSRGNDVQYYAYGFDAYDPSGTQASMNASVMRGDSYGHLWVGTSSGVFSDSGWHHIAGNWVISASCTQTVYVDGSSLATGSTRYSNNSNAYPNRIGGTTRDAPYAYMFYGSIEEVRFSNTTRADAWIKQEYTTVHAGLTYGTPQGPPATGIPRQSDFYNRMRGN